VVQQHGFASLQAREVVDDLLAGHLPWQAHVTGQVADALVQCHFVALRIHSQHVNRPGCRANDVEHTANSGGFASAVWPQKTKDFTLLNAYRYAFDGLDLSI